jgi:hypothetical protein
MTAQRLPVPARLVTNPVTNPAANRSARGVGVAVDGRPGGDGESTTEQSAAGRTRALPDLSIWLAIWSVALVAYSFRRAAEGASSSVYYALFWAGLLPAMGYLAARLLWPRFGAWRLTNTLILALLTWFPKFLRNPYGPLYHDEFAHVRAVNDVAATGGLYTKNPLISIIGQYPGLHILTWGLQTLSGLPLWSSGLLVVGLAHLVGVGAVFIIGQALFGSRRAGGIMAFVYVTNPDALYFDNQFAYESLGLVLMLSAVALAVLAAGSEARAARRALMGAAALTGAACVMTHHLSALFLLILVTVVVLAVGLARRGVASVDSQVTPPRLAPWVGLWCAVAATAVLWLSTAARATLSYLAPYAGPALRQLVNQASGSSKGRQLFAGGVHPEYERIASFAAPVLLLAIVVYALPGYWRARDRWRAYPVQLACAAFGLLYFPAAIFIFAPIGAEGARRSWGFSYLGIALIVTAVLCVQLPRAPEPASAALHRADPATVQLSRRARSIRAVAAIAAVCCLIVGNVSAGLNDSYRFPGPYQFGSESRSLTPELRSLAEQFGQLVGPQRVVTDRFTGLAIVQFGQAFTASPTPSFPAWELITSTADPSRQLAQQLVSSSFDYLIIDSRLSSLLPLIGNYFEPTEPFANASQSPFPATALNRLNTVSWASKIVQTDHYSVYRLHLQGLVAP